MRKRPKITERKYDQWAGDIKAWIVDSVSPFDDDTPEKQAGRVAASEVDLLFFCETYLPHYFTAPFGDFHREWAAFVDIKDEAAFLAAPREHGKSTFFSFAVPLWNFIFKKRFFQVVISDTSDQAIGFTLPIKLELEDNPRLSHDYGDLIGSTWQIDNMVSKCGQYRITGKGRTQKIRGIKHLNHRIDFAVIDDFENDVTVENPNIVEKGKSLIQKAVMGSLGAGFGLIMVGNLFHPKSVLSSFMFEKDERGRPLYLSKIYQAWLDYGKETQRPIWPELWSAARLDAKMRQMGRIAFFAEMLNLTGEESSPFPAGSIRYGKRIDGLQTVTFCDPSSKDNETNDFKGIVTVGYDRSSMEVIVLEAWIRHSDIESMFDEIYFQSKKYNSIVGIEENMLKDFLDDSINSYALRKNRWIPFLKVNHRTNKIGRIISTLQYLNKREKLRFRKNHSDQDRLIDQMIYIKNKNVADDGADALEGAVKLMQEHCMGDQSGYRPVKRKRFAGHKGAW